MAKTILIIVHQLVPSLLEGLSLSLLSGYGPTISEMKEGSSSVFFLAVPSFCSFYGLGRTVSLVRLDYS